MIDDSGAQATDRENELIRCCARVSPSPEVADRITWLVQQPLDWSKVLSRAWWHRVRPLVYRHVMAQPGQTMPPEVRAKLEDFIAELSQRCKRLEASLYGLADLFEQRQLRGLVFKGPTLAVDAYGDVTLRECGDLDLLISQAEFPRIQRALEADGFVSKWENPEHRQQVFACDFHRADAALDVHWALAPGWFNFRVDFERFWQAAESITPQTSLLRKLRAEDALSVLCIHGSKHWWDRLRWICDVAELINSQRVIDWDRVMATATATHCRRTVEIGLYLSHSLLDARLPEPVWRDLQRRRGIARLSSQVERWLETAERSKQMRNTRDRFWFRMGTCERFRDQVPQILHYLLARRRTTH